jgi:hypothetical protein
MAAISRRSPEVDIHYDRRGVRVIKHFTDPYEARRFYMRKLAAGLNPAVKKPSN